MKPELDVRKLRHDFPALETRVHGKPLIYLDNASTSQKPRAVLEAMDPYYTAGSANVHRSVHELGEVATRSYEGARVKVQRFLHARDAREIIFARGTTEAINLVAQSYVKRLLRPGDEILITALEHHSNIVPWQMLREETGATLRVAAMSDQGELLLQRYQGLLGPRTKLVSLTHASNALGSVNPIREMVEHAHARGIPVLVDGAQAVPHLAMDVQELDCDFYAFSGHKVFGPTGIGVLYGKSSLLESMPPYQGGGDMIRSVRFETTVYADAPQKFEAGTPNIAGAIGLGSAVDYLSALDRAAIGRHEEELLLHATEALSALPGLRILGQAGKKVSIVSFLLEGTPPHDLAVLLDQEGIAIRAGHLCAQPVLERLGVEAAARASFAFYNTHEEVDALAAGLRELIKTLR